MNFRKTFIAIFFGTFSFCAPAFSSPIKETFPKASASKEELNTAADSIYRIAEWYINNGSYNKALPYLLKAENLAGMADAKTMLPRIYKTLSVTLEHLQNYKGAYIYYQAFINIKDSIDKDSAIRLQQNVNSDYEKQINTNAAQLAEVKNKLHLIETENQNQLRTYFLAATLLLLLLVTFIFIKHFQLKSKFRASLNEKDQLITKLNDRISEIEATDQRKESIEISQPAKNQQVTIPLHVQDNIPVVDVLEKSEPATLNKLTPTQDVVENDSTSIGNEKNHAPDFFHKISETHLATIESSIRKNDWQTIKQQVHQLHKLLNDAGFYEFENLFHQFYSLDGNTPHRIWFESTNRICIAVKEKAKEMELS